MLTDSVEEGPLVNAFREAWAQLAPIGRASDGGYVRYAWSPPELTLREWFHAQAARRAMPVLEDGNGNLFATWSAAGPPTASTAAWPLGGPTGVAAAPGDGPTPDTPAGVAGAVGGGRASDTTAGIAGAAGDGRAPDTTAGIAGTAGGPTPNMTAGVAAAASDGRAPDTTAGIAAAAGGGRESSTTAGIAAAAGNGRASGTTASIAAAAGDGRTSGTTAGIAAAAGDGRASGTAAGGAGAAGDGGDDDVRRAGQAAGIAAGALRAAAAGAGVLTGSHFDSVPHGGGYDGPLGIVSAFLAIDELRARGVEPVRPITVAAFAEEEGARFGVACLGSRLLTGAIEPERAADLTDRDGVSLRDVLGGMPAGARPDLLAGFGSFVELHIEQGRALDTAVGVASAIWPHGRWRMDFTGEGNHAGTTLMADRRDPMLTFAFAVLAANKQARLRGGHATVGRVAVTPNATNAVPAAVHGWLDARAGDDETLAAMVDDIARKVAERAARDGARVRFTPESTSGEVRFDRSLAERLREVLDGAPILPTGAGHDAGVLATRVPTAMIFVRNPTGVSHAPAERATDGDCAAGVLALAATLEELSCRPPVVHEEVVRR